MEKNKTLSKSGEQAPSSSGQEEPVPSTSAEERTCPFDKLRGMTCPFDEHRRRTCHNEDHQEMTCPFMYSGKTCPFVHLRITCTFDENRERPAPSTSAAAAGPAPSTSAAAARPAPSTSAEERTCPFDKLLEMTCPFDEHRKVTCPNEEHQGMTCPFVHWGKTCPFDENRERPVPSTSAAAARPVPSTGAAAAGPVPSTSSGQPSRAHQPMFFVGENSSPSDTEIEESSAETENTERSSSGDVIHIGRGYVYRIGDLDSCEESPDEERHVQIERVPRVFDGVELRNSIESTVFSAENALDDNEWYKQYYRVYSEKLKGKMTESLASRTIPLAEDELHRKRSYEYHLQAYHKFVDKWDRTYSTLLKKTDVQINLLGRLHSRLRAITRDPINIREADEIYDMIDYLETSLNFTSLLSRKILQRSELVEEIVSKIAVCVEKKPFPDWLLKKIS